MDVYLTRQLSLEHSPQRFAEAENGRYADCKTALVFPTGRTKT